MKNERSRISFGNMLAQSQAGQVNQSMNAIVPMDSLPELVKVSAKLQVRKKKKSKSMIVRQDSQRIIPEASFKDFESLC